MVKWRTRTKGSARQIGQHFPVTGKGEKSKLPTALRVVSFSKTGKPIYEKVPAEKAEKEESNEDVVEEAVEELREEESLKQKLTREIAEFKEEIEKRDRRARLKEALKELEKREQEGVYYQPEEEEEF